jgi:hypothetical protein
MRKFEDPSTENRNLLDAVHDALPLRQASSDYSVFQPSGDMICCKHGIVWKRRVLVISQRTTNQELLPPFTDESNTGGVYDRRSD